MPSSSTLVCPVPQKEKNQKELSDLSKGGAATAVSDWICKVNIR